MGSSTPSVAPGIAAAQPLPKAPTGIDGFDDITFGGLPRGRPTLVCGGAGCGKTLFAMTFLVNGVRQFGEAGVLLSFEEGAGDLAANVASLGYESMQNRGGSQAALAVTCLPCAGPKFG